LVETGARIGEGNLPRAQRALWENDKKLAELARERLGGGNCHRGFGGKSGDTVLVATLETQKNGSSGRRGPALLVVDEISND